MPFVSISRIGVAITIKLPSSHPGNDSIVLISAHVLNLVETRRSSSKSISHVSCNSDSLLVHQTEQRVQSLASCRTVDIGADFRYHDNKASFSDVTSRHFQRLSIDQTRAS